MARPAPEQSTVRGRRRCSSFAEASEDRPHREYRKLLVRPCWACPVPCPSADELWYRGQPGPPELPRTSLRLPTLFEVGTTAWHTRTVRHASRSSLRTQLRQGYVGQARTRTIHAAPERHLALPCVPTSPSVREANLLATSGGRGPYFAASGFVGQDDYLVRAEGPDQRSSAAIWRPACELHRSCRSFRVRHSCARYTWRTRP